ncbi:MAG: S53 family serine peptidase [Terracidiphilus sp.]|nr:S53 family serine peptidase [Terracidiphilus sp.]
MKLQRLRVPVLLAMVALACTALGAQTANRITQAVDTAQVQALPHHLPAWASSANQTGLAASNLQMEQMTLVLARSSAQEAALDQFLADQQNTASSNYHRWLTPEEMGERFGLSDQDIATITSWLQSQGLHVNWVAPNRTFIGFGGTAAQVNQAFQTELHTYTVNGDKRYSISSDPQIPTALAPAIKSIRGLSTPGEKPAHHIGSMQSASPQMTVTSGSTTYHFIAPADFSTIYNVPTSYTGAGYTIGIVSWARVNTADLSNFRSLTGTSFPNPTVVVPTAYGGVDPGAAYTTTQNCTNGCLDGQEEATLDILRAGSTAQGASLLLVASSSSGTDDGIGADAQYLVNTSPVPAQVMSISFGDCETNEGSSGVSYWDSLFKTAAGEGISVFVSSGDSGAAGCDTAFSAPPKTATANSPNYICSSSYATCVGGTEFNDTSSPSTYWNSSDGSYLSSALSYIPEGGWNESTASSVAGSGGGVSSYIATPSWQKGVTGVPTAYAGRYTPDVSFSAAGHDGYFACLAADSGSCVVSGGSYSFLYFSGTSATAPAMAGVAALLDQKLGAAQGNLNPGLYTTATNYSAAFHDTTVSSSGAGTCSVNTVSLCNNSIYKSSSSVQAGYAVGTGYDEVTGLGSLDVLNFLNDYTTVAATAPTATTGSASSITYSTATLAGTVTPNSADTTVWFLYGASSTLSGATQTTSQDIGSGTTATAVTASLSGLSAGTKYYYEIVAKNSAGTTDGSIGSFTTSAASAPTATTGLATSITSTTATLNATVNPNDADTKVWFLYGASSTLSGATQTTSQDIGSGTTATAVTASLSGLSASTTYYFEVVAQNSVGTTDGTISSFTTSAVPVAPTATTGSASSTSSTAATLNATANPNGTDTKVWFLYGASSSLSGATQTTSQDIGSGTTATAVTASLSSLSASTTYYFEVVAQNSAGTTYGAINSFTTSATPTFTVTGTAVTISTPGASATSTITVAASDSFTGTASVALTASITSSPSGAVYTPTLSFGSTTPVSITSSSSATATLTISTTAASSASLARPMRKGLPWYAEGGATLACILLFGIPARRRRWRNMLGTLVLLVALAGGIMACGGSGGSSSTGSTGTTTGTYTITITGTSGSTVATNTVTLTVN